MPKVTELLNSELKLELKAALPKACAALVKLIEEVRLPCDLEVREQRVRENMEVLVSAVL